MLALIVFILVGGFIHAAPTIFQQAQGSKAERDMKKMLARIDQQQAYGPRDRFIAANDAVNDLSATKKKRKWI